jgi:hypothetical protein
MSEANRNFQRSKESAERTLLWRNVASGAGCGRGIVAMAEMSCPAPTVAALYFWTKRRVIRGSDG